MKSRRKFLVASLWAAGGAVLTAPLWALLFGVTRYETKSNGALLERDWESREPIPPNGGTVADLAAVRLPLTGEPSDRDLARAGELTVRVLDALGGMKRFIKKGDTVYVKPNMSWARPPELAATTNPDVVATLVRLAREAGAAEVLVGDRTCEEKQQCYEKSLIQAAVEAQGGRVVHPRAYRKVRVTRGTFKEWEIDQTYLKADKVINVPIAKHHMLTGATLAMKNLYGIVGGERSRLHQRVHHSIAELALHFRPTLNVIDGVRVLTKNGPAGGLKSYVAYPMGVVASPDPVAADAFALRHFFADRYGGEKILPTFIARAEELGVGRSDYAKMKTYIEGF